VLDRITPLILTRDESANIARTLGQLAWAREVVVVDSFSDDDTVTIARTFANVRVVQRRFDTMEQQWSFGVAQIASEWVLTLDADYFATDAFVRELAALQPPQNVSAYEARFIYAIDGRPLRATLYTPRPVLLRIGRFSIYQDGHTQRVRVDGAIERLREPLIHDDRKSWPRFLERQRVYMRQEAAKLRSTPWRKLNATGRVRRLLVVAPFAVLVHTLFVRGLILDGRAGVAYAWERFVAELILSRELINGRA